MDLVNRRGSTLAWRSSRQLPRRAHAAVVHAARSRQLEAGDYDLIVRGHSPDHEEVVARFWLRVSSR